MPREREWLRHELGEQVDAHKYVRGAGCSQCNDTGYLGRTGVYEMLEMTRPVVEAANSGDPSPVPASRAQADARHTLRRHAAMLAAEGRTTVEEAMRVSTPTRGLKRAWATSPTRRATAAAQLVAGCAGGRRQRGGGDAAVRQRRDAGRDRRDRRAAQGRAQRRPARCASRASRRSTCCCSAARCTRC